MLFSKNLSQEAMLLNTHTHTHTSPFGPKNNRPNSLMSDLYFLSFLYTKYSTCLWNDCLVSSKTHTHTHTHTHTDTYTDTYTYTDTDTYITRIARYVHALLRVCFSINVFLCFYI